MADNSKALQRSDPNYDKLWKVRYLLSALSSKFLELYNPYPQISMDESMIGTNQPSAGFHLFSIYQRSWASRCESVQMQSTGIFICLMFTLEQIPAM